MPSSTLTCSQEACKDKRQHLKHLSYKDLSIELEKCEKCENGLFKTNFVAAKTYQIIALHWAQMHNVLTCKTIGN